MMRRRLLSGLGVVVAGSLLATAATAATTSQPHRVRSATPRWVKHVERYPGGISDGVRATLGTRGAGVKTSARGSTVATRSNPQVAASLSNVQANTDTVPGLPQNETAVAYNLDDPSNAVAASNDYIDGGLWIGTTHD